MILSTEDHSELMKNVAAKSSAQFSLIPPVPESAESDEGESLEGVDNSYKQGGSPEGSMCFYLVVGLHGT